MNQQMSQKQEYRKSSDIAVKRRVPREVRFGNYVLGSTLGEGEFGKVKLGWRKDGKLPSQAAIKLIKRDSIPTGSEKESKIYREITALKRLRHPNIVRLVEVLQNDKYIGIVLEYASGGELFDYILDHRYLKESLACRLFAQLVSGVDYMHSKGIVHRDLKLENLLLDKHKNIIITDFGFVNSFQNPNNDFMKTSCGSPCYAAPELVVSSEPYEGKKVDIWSCGVILYAMLAGYLPFDDDPQNPDGTNIARLYHYITHTPLTFPEYIQPTPRDLLRRILVANPNRRINLKDIRSHRWLAPHVPFLSVTPIEWDKNYRSSKLVNQQDKINRRMSLMENPTSASLMLNKQNVRSYSTQNVQASLFSNPAAPQTSHTVAIPSAEASPVASPVRHNPTLSNDDANTGLHNNGNSITNNNNNTMNSMSTSNNNPRHSRSGSAASLVLQAVVDADVENKRRYSNGSSDILTTPIRNSSQRPISFAPMLLDNNKKFESIKESPENSKTKVLPLPAPVFTKPAVSTGKLPSSRINKPRPTSYHPSYTSNASTTDLSYIATTNFSENSLRANNRVKPTTSMSNYSSTNESLMSTSNKDSSPPTINEKHNNTDNDNNNDSNKNNNNNNLLEGAEASMSKDNDILGTSNGKAKNGIVSTATVNTPADYSNQRHSYAMDLLTNAFDTLSMMSKSAADVVDLPKADNEKFNIYNESEQNGSLVRNTEHPNNNIGNNSKSNFTIYETSETEKENLTASENELLKARNNLATRSEKVNVNSNSNTRSNASETKYKRFSLLTFYQNIPEPTAPSNYLANNSTSAVKNDVYSLSNSSRQSIVTGQTPKALQHSTFENGHQSSAAIVSTPSTSEIQSNLPSQRSVSTTQTKQRKVSTNSNSSTNSNRTKSTIKPLEPSNIKSERRVSSINVYDKNAGNDKNDDRTAKETSTARKVMDFFKRRSMRI